MKKISIFLLMLFAFTFFGCTKDAPYQPKPIEASHHIYDEEFSSYLKLSSALQFENDAFYPIYSITAHMHILQGTARKILYYQVDWLEGDGNYQIYYRNDDDTEVDSRYIGQEFLPYIKVGGNSIREMKASYTYERTIDGVYNKKELSFYEPVLTFNEEEFTELSDEIENVLQFGAQYRSDSEDHRFKFFIDFSESEKPSHIDMQSWVKTADGTVYPLTGFYHYVGIAKDYLSVSDEKITKTINLESIYIKLIYSDQETQKTVYYHKILEELPENKQ